MSLLSWNLIKVHTKNLLKIIGNHILGKLICVCFLAKPKLHSYLKIPLWLNESESLISAFQCTATESWHLSSKDHRVHQSYLLILHGLHTFVIFLFSTRLTLLFFVLLKSSPQDFDICCCYRSPRKKALSIFMISKIAKREICVLLWLKI